MLMEAPPAGAFSTQMVNNSNPDGTARFVDPDEQAPFLGSNEGSTGGWTHVFKVPSLGGTADKAQSEGIFKGSTFSPEETRLLFGPFNHFGYGGSNQ
jgi:hypothetical protein